MKKNRICKVTAIFAFVCVLLVGLSLILQKRQMNQDELSGLLVALSDGMQMKSIFLVYGFFTIGALILYELGAGEKQIILLALPLGTALCTVCVYIMFCFGVRCTILNVLAMVIFLIVLLIIVGYRERCKKITISEEFVGSLIVAYGILALASIGFAFLFQGSDTYCGTYIASKVVMKEGGLLTDTLQHIFTNSGMGSCALSLCFQLFGIDSLNTLHMAFIFNMVAITVSWLYTRWKTKYKYSLIISILVAGFIWGQPSILMLSRWMYSNTYFMFALICIVYLLEKETENDFSLFSSVTLMFLFLFAMTLRTDSIILLMAFVFGMTRYRFDNSKIIKFFLIPGGLLQLAYYVRLYILCDGNVDGYYINVERIGLFFLLVLGVGLYYGLIRNKHLIWLQEHLMGISCIIVLFLIIAAFIYDYRTTFETFRIIITNMTQSGGLSWGYTSILLIFAIAFWILCSRKCKAIDYLIMVMLFTVPMMALIRAFTIGWPPRIGFGDSFNRELISYLPLFFINSALEWGDYLKQQESYE